MKAPKPYLAALLAACGIAVALPLAVQAAGPLGDGPGCGGRMSMERGGPGGGMGMFGGDHGPAYLRGLNLTEEQQDKVFALMHAQAPAMRAKFKELREARGNLEALAQAPTYDEARVRALTDKSAATLAEIARMHARTENQIYQLLTPEQRKQLAEHKAQRDERGPGMMRHGPGMGMGQG